jgi:hypothetical protein
MHTMGCEFSKSIKQRAAGEGGAGGAGSIIKYVSKHNTEGKA